MKELLGIAAAVIVIVGIIPYIRDIVWGTTRPARSTWLLLSLLIMLDLLAQNDIGVGWAIALTIGEVIATVTVFALSIKYGIGGFSNIDKVSYVIWLGMVGVWQVTDSPLLALHFGIVADFVSLVPTLVKSWREPWQESKSVFISSSIAGFFGVLAALSFEYENIVLPLYLMLVNAFVAAVLLAAETRFKNTSR